MKLKKMSLIKTSLAALTLLIVSCGGNDATKGKTLVQLEKKRDALKAKYGEIGKELAEIEAAIIALDTTLKAPLVTVMKMERNSFSSYFRVQGNVQTDQNAQVLPEVPGVIKKIFVNEGDNVSKGQKLVLLDDNLLRIQIQQLEMNLTLATDLFQKQERLWKQNIGSEVQYLQAKNTVNNIEEQIKQVKETLNKYVINAPFTGVIDQLNLKEGEFASQMQPMLRILNLSTMYIQADVSESYIALIKKGMPVNIVIPNLDTIKSNITRIGNYINPENRTFKVTVNLPKNELLKPNLVGSISIADYTSSNTFKLKTSMLMHDAENRSFLFVAVNNGNKLNAKKLVVETGKSYQGYTEVLKGLTGEEIIIEKGARKLVDGQEIRLK
jgi:membrane fusion protein (multidrug efflux system)